MKFFVAACLLAQIIFASAKILPNNFPSFCSKNDPEYNKCMESALEKMGPYLLKGVKSIDFPKLHPLEISSYTFNRTLNSMVSVAAVIKNMQVYGFDRVRVESFYLNPETLEGKLHLVIPRLDAKLEYQMNGKLLTLSLNSEGFLTGSASNLDLIFDYKLKKVDKLGVEYYAFDRFSAKGSSLQTGHIKIKAKDPAQQPAVDFIANFFNDDPKPLIDAFQPIYEENIEVFYRSFAERFLSSLPANEFIPE